MDIPDVIGFTLSDAEIKLKGAGVSVAAVKVTLPPREAVIEAEGYFRVLRVKESDRQKVELIVCKPL